MGTRDAVVPLLSGGVDSLVLVASLLNDGRQVLPFAVDYGQRHWKELRSAEEIAHHYGLRLKIAPVQSVGAILKGSSQTSPSVEVPEGHYADESMKATVVPNRNMLLMALAAGYAITEGANEIAYAAHKGDYAIYPDCRPEFCQAVDRVLGLCHHTPLHLNAPFLHITKTGIVRLGRDLNVPFHLSWSCYKGGAAHCGKCGTCFERREAFEEAGVLDPVVYAERVAIPQ